MDSPSIVIPGAGGTGLGAAYRLEELGHRDFQVLETFVEANGHRGSWRL